VYCSFYFMSAWLGYYNIPFSLRLPLKTISISLPRVQCPYLSAPHFHRKAKTT
jgi:hypothetical protein